MPSSRPAPSPRRQMFLKLSGMIEGQLRDAYDKKFTAGELNQSSLAANLGINRSAVHHRLSGRTNMTIETIADMVWGLGQDIEIKIFDPVVTRQNHKITTGAPTLVPPAVPPIVVNKPITNAAVSQPATSTTIVQKFLEPAMS